MPKLIGTGERLDFLRRFLPYERGIPAHDTLNDVINGLDAELFANLNPDYLETLIRQNGR